MRIDAKLTPNFPEKENQFNYSVVLMIDVLRASTTICSALYHGAREIIPTEATEKAIQIFSNLSKEMRFLGGERNGSKPTGFDAGNSPSEYNPESVQNKTIIFTTSNGTKIFQKAKAANLRIIAGFVNHKAIIDYLFQHLSNNNNVKEINLLCAGNDGNLSYEDTICAGAFINSFNHIFQIDEMTDSAHVALNLFRLHLNDMKDFLSSREHALKLKSLGFFEDIDLSLSFDTYPVVPVISNNSIKQAIN